MKIISFELKLSAVRPNYVTTMHKWMFAQNRVVILLQYTISFQNLILVLLFQCGIFSNNVSPCILSTQWTAALMHIVNY